jgi:hypothetical protein
MHAHADAFTGVDRVARDDRAVRIGVGNVMSVARVVERVGPSPRAVDELVEHDEVTGVNVGRERTGRARRDHLAHAEHAHRPEVGARGNARGHELVVASVAGNERNPPPADVGDRDRCAWRAERRVEHDVFDIVTERVEAGAAEDPDLRGRECDHFGFYALLAVEPLPELEELESEPEDFLSVDFDDDESEPEELDESELDDPESELEEPESDEEDEDDSFERSLDAPFDDDRLSVL